MISPVVVLVKNDSDIRCQVRHHAGADVAHDPIADERVEIALIDAQQAGEQRGSRPMPPTSMRTAGIEPDGIASSIRSFVKSGGADRARQPRRCMPGSAARAPIGKEKKRRPAASSPALRTCGRLGLNLLDRIKPQATHRHVIDFSFGVVPAHCGSPSPRVPSGRLRPSSTGYGERSR